MGYILTFTERAQLELLRLESTTRRRIMNKLDHYVSTPSPMRHAKPLGGGLYGNYRFRVGMYRVLFSVSDQGYVTVLEVFRIGHRKNVYK